MKFLIRSVAEYTGEYPPIAEATCEESHERKSDGSSYTIKRWYVDVPSLDFLVEIVKKYGDITMSEGQITLYDDSLDV